MAALPDVVGLREQDALALLEQAGGVAVRVVRTRPPKRRHRDEPVAWRVICVRPRGDAVEVVVTPEWLPYKMAEPVQQAGEPE